MPEGTTKVITVSVDSSGVSVNPRVVEVSPGDKVQFERVGDNQGLLLRVTFSDVSRLSAPVYNEGDPPIDVRLMLIADVQYECQLIGSDPNSQASGGGTLKAVQGVPIPVPTVVVKGDD